MQGDAEDEKSDEASQKWSVVSATAHKNRTTVLCTCQLIEADKWCASGILRDSKYSQWSPVWILVTLEVIIVILSYCPSWRHWTEKEASVKTRSVSNDDRERFQKDCRTRMQHSSETRDVRCDMTEWRFSWEMVISKKWPWRSDRCLNDTIYVNDTKTGRGWILKRFVHIGHKRGAWFDGWIMAHPHWFPIYFPWLLYVATRGYVKK